MKPVEKCNIFNDIYLSILVMLCLIMQTVLFIFHLKCKNNHGILALVVVGLGSQIMLLISAVWGYRCMFSMYTVYIMIIIFILDHLDRKEICTVLLCGAVICIDPIWGIIVWFACLFLKRKEKVFYIISVNTIRIVVVYLLLGIFLGYYGNADTHKQNAAEVENARSTKVLVVHSIPDTTYSWYRVPFNEGQEYYYCRYYDLNDLVSVEYD